MQGRGRLATDAVLGLLGVALGAALLAASERAFALHEGDSDLIGALLLLAAAGQAAPSLGLVLTVQRLLLRITRVQKPRAHSRGLRPAGPPQGQNLLLVALFAFAMSFLGVFALVHSTVFVPLVALVLMGWFLYVPLARDVARARVVWSVLSVSAVGFGVVGLSFLTLAHR